VLKILARTKCPVIKSTEPNGLRNTNLKVNLKYCEFVSDNLSYLGYRLTSKEILSGSDKLKAVQASESPKTVHKVRQFMGLCYSFNFKSELLPRLAAPCIN
jgi:hypothetical protein